MPTPEFLLPDIDASKRKAVTTAFTNMAKAFGKEPWPYEKYKRDGLPNHAVIWGILRGSDLMFREAVAKQKTFYYVLLNVYNSVNLRSAVLNYKSIETNKYLVCFTPEAFLQLISAFSSMFNARSIIDGLSLMKEDSIGNQISVPNLNISDEGLHPKNVGAFSFDGEGTPTQNIQLVSNGILTNLLQIQLMS